MGIDSKNDQLVYSGEAIQVIRRSKSIKSEKVDFEFVNRDNVAIVIPIIDLNKIVVTRQFRAPFNSYILEFPGGKVGVDESFEHAAIRECEEETGLIPHLLIELSEIFSSPHFSNEIVKIFLGTKISKGETQFSNKEYIETNILSLEELKTIVESGNMKDAKSLIGYYSLISYLKKNKDVK